MEGLGRGKTNNVDRSMIQTNALAETKISLRAVLQEMIHQINSSCIRSDERNMKVGPPPPSVTAEYREEIRIREVVVKLTDCGEESTSAARGHTTRRPVQPLVFSRVDRNLLCKRLSPGLEGITDCATMPFICSEIGKSSFKPTVVAVVV